MSGSCVFPVLAQGFAQNWWGLLLCRLFMGLGQLPPAHIESHLLIKWRCRYGCQDNHYPNHDFWGGPGNNSWGSCDEFSTMGCIRNLHVRLQQILLKRTTLIYLYRGFCSNLIFYRIGRLAWRFQLAAAFVPAIPILIFVWMCPGVYCSTYLTAIPS